MKPLLRRAADELASLHSITSSTRIWSDSGRSNRGTGGFEIDEQLELGRLVDRQVARVVALQNASDVDAVATIRIRQVVAVAHQAARRDVLAARIDRRDCVARREGDDLIAPVEVERIGRDDERRGPLLHEGGEGRVDFVRRSGIDNDDPPAEHARRFLHVRQLRPGIRIARIDEHRNDTGAGNEFVQQRQPLRRISALNQLIPVALPPGRLRLVTRPIFTGSPPMLKTIGIVAVAALAARVEP